MKNLNTLFCSIVLLFLISCGTKTLRDNAIQLKGPIPLKIKVSNNDSAVQRGTNIKISFRIPDSIVARDGMVIRNIVKATYSFGALAREIDTVKNFAYKSPSYNFITGMTDKSRCGLNIEKGVYGEDTYVCRDFGVFWFSLIPQSSIRFWAADGKEYNIAVTEDFDVPDRHTDMLVRYCPSIAAYLDVMQQDGFGHYCFKVVP